MPPTDTNALQLHLLPSEPPVRPPALAPGVKTYKLFVIHQSAKHQAKTHSYPISDRNNHRVHRYLDRRYLLWSVHHQSTSAPSNGKISPQSLQLRLLFVSHTTAAQPIFEPSAPLLEQRTCDNWTTETPSKLGRKLHDPTLGVWCPEKPRRPESRRHRRICHP